MITKTLQMGRSMILGVIRCKACMRVTFQVFLAICLVEILILIPSYAKFKTDWLEAAQSKSLAVSRAVIEQYPSGNPKIIAEAVGAASFGTSIVGGVLLGKDLNPLAAFGEPPDISLRADGMVLPAQLLDTGGKYHDVFLSPADNGSPHGLYLRLDTGDLGPALWAFVGRIAVLVIIISLFVTAATALVLSRTLFEPLLDLRNRLLAVGVAPEKADTYMRDSSRADEIGDVMRSFNDMLARITADIRTIRSKEEQLLQARDQLEDKVIERTRALKESEQRLLVKANVDDLTGLPNRMLGMDRLEQSLSYAKRYRQKMALLFIDMDNFKAVNDTMGHNSGDQLLGAIATRFRACLRDSDTVARLLESDDADRPAPETVARIGGDEFMVVLPSLNGAEDADIVASKILDACTEPFELEGREIFMTTSVGIALYPDDGETPLALMANADNAMYEAKKSGGSTRCFFHPEMNERLRQHHEIEARLRHALERGELYLNVQPLVDISSNRIEGFETLLRWHNPDLGQVYPDQFIPVAECTGLILPIGEWVLTEACRIAASLSAEVGYPLRAAVNLSVQQFRRDVLPASIERALAASNLPVDQLELEITESLLINDSSEVPDLLRDIRAQGMRVSIDDFGTGYSSLGYLKRFPVDVLKIDKSFMAGVADDEGDQALVLAVLSMAHSLGLEVVAEGIEDAQQQAFLAEHGCQYGQGYFFGRPMPPEELADHIRLFSPKSGSEIG